MSISKILAGYCLAVLMSATVLAQSDYGTGVSVGVPYVAPGAIALDGDGSEAAWTSARVIDPLAHVDEPYSHKGFSLSPGIAAEARLLYGEGVLYVYVEVEDSEQYFDPSAAYNSDVILVGVDLIHAAGVTDQQTDATFSGFASNAPDNGPVVYQALPNADVLLHWSPGPVSNGWADGQAFANATSWGVEMAIYGAEIVPGAEVGLNVGLFIAKEAGVFDRPNGDGGFDYTYAFASWQVCDPNTQTGTFWCGPGGTVLSDAHSFATAKLEFDVGAAIQLLRENVEALGLTIGLEKALLAKLANAAASLDRGNTSATSGQLGAFVHHVHAKRGEDLSDAQADGLIVLAEAAIDELAAGSLSKSSGAVHTVEAPDAFVLEGNYPNPFNPQTSIRFAIPEASHVRLTVYDALGREVKVLVNGVLDAGKHDATFDAGNLASGTYLYRLETANGVVNRTMVLMK